MSGENRRLSEALAIFIVSHPYLVVLMVVLLAVLVAILAVRFTQEGQAIRLKRQNLDVLLVGPRPLPLYEAGAKVEEAASWEEGDEDRRVS